MLICAGSLIQKEWTPELLAELDGKCITAFRQQHILLDPEPQHGVQNFKLQLNWQNSENAVTDGIACLYAHLGLIPRE